MKEIIAIDRIPNGGAPAMEYSGQFNPKDGRDYSVVSRANGSINVQLFDRWLRKTDNGNYYSFGFLEKADQLELLSAYFYQTDLPAKWDVE